MLAPPEVARDAAVDVPLVRREDALVHLHRLGGAPVVAHDTRHVNLAKAGSHGLQASGYQVDQVLDRLLGGAIVGLHQLLMNVTPQHIASQSDDAAWVSDLCAPHM